MFSLSIQLLISIRSSYVLFPFIQIMFINLYFQLVLTRNPGIIIFVAFSFVGSIPSLRTNVLSS